MSIKKLAFVFVLSVVPMLAQDSTQPQPNIDRMLLAVYWLFLGVFLVLPLYAIAIRIWLSKGAKPVGLRAFNLPSGSIRRCWAYSLWVHL